MTLPADFDRAVARLRARPGATALLFDFDGTLSPVVDDPAAASPSADVPELLDALAQRYLQVAVLSGRPVDFLASMLPTSVALSGLYGLETRVDGAVVDHPEAVRWRPRVAEALQGARDAAGAGGPIHGAVVEAKGLSLTLHVRTRPELAAAVGRVAATLADQTGLVVRPAKMSVELHPPIDADKGSALRSLVGGAGAVLFVGDDVGDLPAFAALEQLDQGIHAVAVAVDSDELPDEVRRSASLVLPNQADVVQLLRALVV